MDNPTTDVPEDNGWAMGTEQIIPRMFKLYVYDAVGACKVPVNRMRVEENLTHTSIWVHLEREKKGDHRDKQWLSGLLLEAADRCVELAGNAEQKTVWPRLNREDFKKELDEILTEHFNKMEEKDDA